MAQYYTQEQLIDIGKRNNTQFHYVLPNGQIIPAGINPDQAATTNLHQTVQQGGGTSAGDEIWGIYREQIASGIVPASGGSPVYDRSTPEGQYIASQSGQVSNISQVTGNKNLPPVDPSVQGVIHPTPTPAPPPPAPQTASPAAFQAPPTSPSLTQDQINAYYASEGQKTNPLSPLEWATKQTAVPASGTVQPQTQLSPEQIDSYFASESSKPNPQSPLNWLASQTPTSGATTGASTSPTIPQISGATPSINYAPLSSSTATQPSYKTQTITPSYTPAPRADLSEFEKAYLALLQPSSDELAAQKQLADFISSRDTGLASIKNEPIAMPLIIGQQAALEEQANIKAQTLERQLAILQSQRQSALAASQFSLDRADKQAEIQRQEAEEARIFDENVRQFGMQYALSQQQLAQQKYEFDTTSGISQKEFDENMRQFGLENALAQKKVSESSGTGTGTTSSGLTSGQQQTSQSLTLVNNLLAEDTNAITGIGQNPLNFAGVTNQKAINEYNELKAQLALGARALLKGSGAVSDYEARVLEQSTTALGRNLSNEAFTQELKNIRGVLKTNQGQSTEVSVIDPKTGTSKVGVLNGTEIYSAVSQGYQIQYL